MLRRVFFCTCFRSFALFRTKKPEQTRKLQLQQAKSKLKIKEKVNITFSVRLGITQNGKKVKILHAFMKSLCTSYLADTFIKLNEPFYKILIRLMCNGQFFCVIND